jgi:exopolyphosphatase/guanosine-5'-triphosphate,3'-diphosphate pyrophosphatase
MKINRLAAIDIGSNSLRLLITNVVQTKDQTYFRKVSITRLPVRLGEEVFLSGCIKKSTGKRLVDSMHAFSAIMRVHDIDGYRACATSAMRECQNRDYWINEIRKKTNIDVEVIDGKDEAKLVFSAQLLDKIKPKETNLLFADVGGGSTELTIFQNGYPRKSKSFKIGTVRGLIGRNSKSIWSELKSWILTEFRDFEEGSVAVIGSGGNINKVHKMSENKLNEPLTFEYLNSIHKKMSFIGYEDRIASFELNNDRADVIIPALEIFLKVLDFSKSSKVYVPKIGLSDGIIREIHRSKYASKEK